MKQIMGMIARATDGAPYSSLSWSGRRYPVRAHEQADHLRVCDGIQFGINGAQVGP